MSTIDMSKMSKTELLAALALAQTENEALKAKKAPRHTIKVSEKGACSVYGLGRFPVSLYRSQWERLFTMVPEIQAFIEANKDKLAEKPVKVEAPVTAPPVEAPVTEAAGS